MPAVIGGGYSGSYHPRSHGAAGTGAGADELRLRRGRRRAAPAGEPV